MFKYDAKDAEGGPRGLLPDGDYPAIIAEAVEMQSKAGNDMLRLTLTIGDKSITDYIVSPAGLWKLKAIAEAIGKLDAFMAQTIECADLNSAEVLVTVGTKPAQGKFHAQNQIVKYAAVEEQY